MVLNSPKRSKVVNFGPKCPEGVPNSQKRKCASSPLIWPTVTRRLHQTPRWAGDLPYAQEIGDSNFLCSSTINPFYHFLLLYPVHPTNQTECLHSNQVWQSTIPCLLLSLKNLRLILNDDFLSKSFF